MNPIKRGALVVLLSLGAIGGFSHGFASMAACHGSCAAQSRRDEFEDHIADVCTRAAQRQYDQNATQQPQVDPRDFDHHHHHGHHGWGGPQQWGGPPPQYWGAPPAPPSAPPAPASAPVTE